MKLYQTACFSLPPLPLPSLPLSPLLPLCKLQQYNWTYTSLRFPLTGRVMSSGYIRRWETLLSGQVGKKGTPWSIHEHGILFFWFLILFLPQWNDVVCIKWPSSLSNPPKRPPPADNLNHSPVQTFWCCSSATGMATGPVVRAAGGHSVKQVKHSHYKIAAHPTGAISWVS